MEGSSVQVHAEYTDRDFNNNRTQSTSLEINLQTLKVFTGATGNNNATDDDITMSGLNYPMSWTTNNPITHMKPSTHSSINTGQIQQQADLARMQQPTIRALQSATDKAINKSKEVANEVFIGPRFANERRTMRRISSAQAGNSNSQNSSKKKHKQAEKNLTAVNTTNAKPKRTKKKKNGHTTFQANPVDGSVNKVKKRKPMKGEKEQHMLYLMERRKFEDGRKLADANLAARADADQKAVVLRTAPESRQWNEMYEQEYQARTIRLRERQIRDEKALMSALNGLSIGEAKDANDD
ncbi:predicted protein [Sclerotinia sclerotiorum 1980 UF-70]|uniref:No apical meristem-associated C-terminal domain-containing protein n=2 Tax=Sclerotinia sclerotiorum (strain ATCC 18683 / 1980 / Ss-1) TaxID=665079 RepID=A7F0U1_SCLS1|nr:predicted protein [Sclerotinia sclerotiorum 1980 UF-70]APA13983.1 hypothetical protein sscle_12g087530 [Sclerotinia sclerotiorum 1980 UF-70]EDN95333.1 predicted protein [Sclerotinia sclerotiorum 1980 UF-70]